MVPFRQTSWQGPGARCERNAELAGQLNCTTDSNPGTAFGNVDDLTLTLGKATQDHPRRKIALHAPLGSLLAFEKHCPSVPSNTIRNQARSPRSVVRIA